MYRKTLLFLEHNVDGTIGGSHICLLGICRYLDKNVWRPIVVFYQDNPLIRDFEEIGVQVHVLEPFRPVVFSPSNYPGVRNIYRLAQSSINFLRMVFVRTWMWIRQLRKLNVDLVHLNNSCAGDIDLVLAAKCMGLPVFAHQRGFPSALGRLDRMMARRLNKIIAVSDVVKEYLRHHGIPDRKIVRIYDGIELERLVQRRMIEDLRTEFGVHPDQLVIGMLGNIKHWKGQEILVKAISHIRKQFSRTLFLFVGEVADDRYLERLHDVLRRDGEESNVLFTGYRPDAVDLVGLMDVVVHASIEPEPFGLVVLEAMGKGKPIVATELGGPRETVIHGSTGLLFESGDPIRLASQVCKLLADSRLRSQMGERGRVHVRERFSAERNAALVQAVFSGSD